MAIQGFNLDSPSAGSPLAASKMRTPHDRYGSPNESYIYNQGHSYLSGSDNIVDEARSATFSTEIAQSPLRYVRHDVAPFTWHTQQQSANDFDAMQHQQQDDDATTNMDGQAGIDLDVMEGIESGNPELNNVQTTPDPSGYPWGGSIGTRLDFLSQPQDACAFAGGGFSVPTNAEQRKLKSSYSQSLGQDRVFSHWRLDTVSCGFKSDKHEPGLAESFPSTQHKWPPLTKDIQDKQQESPTRPRATSNRSKRQAVRSPKLLPSPTRSTYSSGAKMRRRRSTASSIRAESAKLAPISEQWENMANLASPSVGEKLEDQQLQRNRSRAKRNGPLSEDKKSKAGDMRRNRSTCLECKIHKIACDGTIPCKQCTKSRDGRFCLNPHWQPYVEEASCDHSFHLAISPLNLASRHANPLYLSPTFDVPSLMQFLYTFQSTYNLLVTHVTNASYVIRLRSCLPLLSAIDRPFKLKDLFKVDGVGASPSAWLTVLEDFDQERTDAVSNQSKIFNPLTKYGLIILQQRLMYCGIMPSKATYQLVPLDDQLGPLDVVEDRFLLAAAALSRIMLRATEISAHQALQKSCHNLIPNTLREDQWDEAVALVRDLGGVACMMRLRSAFCDQDMLRQIYEDVPPKGSPNSKDRLRLVTRILYFWYGAACRRRNKDFKVSFGNERNFLRLNDGRAILDPLPDSNCLQGFEDWLSYGQTVLTQTGFASQLQGQGPYPESKFDFDLSSFDWDQPSFSL